MKQDKEKKDGSSSSFPLSLKVKVCFAASLATNNRLPMSLDLGKILEKNNGMTIRACLNNEAIYSTEMNGKDHFFKLTSDDIEKYCLDISEEK